MMNFNTIRKVGLSAILAGTFAFGADDSAAAPVLKDADAITMTAKQADRKMKSTFAEQEKLLSAEQRKLWEIIKNHKDFPTILPHIKMNMDITKIFANTNYIIVPFSENKAVTVYKHNTNEELKISCSAPTKEDMVPLHDVPDFIKDKSDCYFYTTKAQLEKLSESEKEYIQTLDKCLNAVFHHMYGTGFVNIDPEKLGNGEMAGFIYETHRLTKKERYAGCITRGRTDLENKFYQQLGYPLQIADLVGMAPGLGIGQNGGCDGEIQYQSTGTAGIFGIPFTKDISKDKGLINTTIVQAAVRQKADIIASTKIINSGISALAKEGLPNASKEFKNLLESKVKTTRTYNSLLLKKIHPNSTTLVESLAKTNVLTSYISENFENKKKDGWSATIVVDHNKSQMAQKKNQAQQRTRQEGALNEI